MSTPAPLVPLDCDVTGLPGSVMDWSRVLDSDFLALSTGDEFKAGFTLWGRSWFQKPAASLPNDERILAKLAGVSIKEWKRLAPMALRGWILCDDGRLYHPVQAGKALAAWANRLSYQRRGAKGNGSQKRRFLSPEGLDELCTRCAEHLQKLGCDVPRGLLSDAASTARPDAQRGAERDAQRSGEERTASAVQDAQRGEVEVEVEVEPNKRTTSSVARRATGRSRRAKPKAPPIWSDAFAAAWEALPEPMKRRSDSREDTWPVWWRAAEEAGGEIVLLGSLRRYLAEDPDVANGIGLKGFHRWLGTSRWKKWTPDPAASAMTEAKWQTAVRLWSEGREWSETWGPNPDEPGCQVPAHLLPRSAPELRVIGGGRS